MEITKQIGNAGTSLSATAGTVMIARRRFGMPHAGYVKAEAHARGVDVIAADKAAGVAERAENRVFGPIFALPTLKQYWVPLCPSERCP
ncbi:hypothetical protein BAY61_04710 [Prauserella marina]|uniref:Uncharacterized protein n=1 Tax=Prauserella marina TaxID=530584 RepID=A0A222VKE8_9PSEU|nr:hypothetical protein [Prauserella marina]ASR34409.1 hypothetical protein BAY61_04710 [Prauserella marina]PWV70959.1 hypothetical protein DES30_11310 [Prauserella marina]SDE00726.1 hypothetical protein SAMN05421630_11657 [Prauserella marina]